MVQFVSSAEAGPSLGSAKQKRERTFFSRHSYTVPSHPALLPSPPCGRVLLPKGSSETAQAPRPRLMQRTFHAIFCRLPVLARLYLVDCLWCFFHFGFLLLSAARKGFWRKTQNAKVRHSVWQGDLGAFDEGKKGAKGIGEKRLLRAVQRKESTTC